MKLIPGDLFYLGESERIWFLGLRLTIANSIFSGKKDNLYYSNMPYLPESVIVKNHCIMFFTDTMEKDSKEYVFLNGKRLLFLSSNTLESFLIDWKKV